MVVGSSDAMASNASGTGFAALFCAALVEVVVSAKAARGSAQERR
jgi:hypothetical protein